jgi:putative hydrolase of the HAD superfamily
VSGLDAVIFDWGDTLAFSASSDEDYRRIVEASWKAAAERLSSEGTDEIAARLEAITEEMWTRNRHSHESTHLDRVVEAVVEDLQLEIAEGLIEEAARDHLDEWERHVKHDPDAVPVLEALRERGLRIGLLSNTFWPASFHERLLERDGLIHLIDGRVYTSDIEFNKPHPAAFQAAMDATGVDDPARVVFVGDRLWDDMHGAQQAGMKTVHRPNPWVPHHDVEPDASIGPLPELLELVIRWIS